MKNSKDFEHEKAVLKKKQEIIFAENKIEVLKNIIKQVDVEIEELEYNYIYK